MNEEIKSYVKTEAIIAAAFNFFINGMVAALVHHKADIVPVDAISALSTVMRKKGSTPVCGLISIEINDMISM